MTINPTIGQALCADSIHEAEGTCCPEGAKQSRENGAANIAELDRLHAALAERDAQLAKSREQAATYANEIGRLTAENARVRQQRDGLLADLTDAGNDVDLLTAENTRLRTALLDVAKTSGTTHVWDHQATDWVPVTKYAASKAEATR